MTARAFCKCGWTTERDCGTDAAGGKRRVEAIANEHEARDVRRPYRHETETAVYDGVKEVVL